MGRAARNSTIQSKSRHSSSFVNSENFELKQEIAMQSLIKSVNVSNIPPINISITASHHSIIETNDDV